MLFSTPHRGCRVLIPPARKAMSAGSQPTGHLNSRAIALLAPAWPGPPRNQCSSWPAEGRATPASTTFGSTRSGPSLGVSTQCWSTQIRSPLQSVSLSQPALGGWVVAGHPLSAKLTTPATPRPMLRLPTSRTRPEGRTTACIRKPAMVVMGGKVRYRRKFLESESATRGGESLDHSCSSADSRSIVRDQEERRDTSAPARMPSFRT